MSEALDLEYHNRCKAACESRGLLLYGSDLNGGFTSTDPSQTWRADWPHEALLVIEELNALKAATHPAAPGEAMRLRKVLEDMPRPRLQGSMTEFGERILQWQAKVDSALARSAPTSPPGEAMRELLNRAGLQLEQAAEDLEADLDDMLATERADECEELSKEIQTFLSALAAPATAEGEAVQTALVNLIDACHRQGGGGFDGLDALDAAEALAREKGWLADA